MRAPTCIHTSMYTVNTKIHTFVCMYSIVGVIATSDCCTLDNVDSQTDIKGILIWLSWFYVSSCRVETLQQQTADKLMVSHKARHEILLLLLLLLLMLHSVDRHAYPICIMQQLLLSTVAAERHLSLPRQQEQQQQQQHWLPHEGSRCQPVN